ncbi:MAG: hypothetical protein SPL86_06445 [Succiniclasticum sp.]|uniref:hypothetical protein n=1 Tax=Succiniclasticum sp. TaxID=2775030 RepID=UPI002A90E08F|nr:hypothetical protein [Succiniclasticum sp.]MDY6291104.1 hypothetical protein [Succiniclasticum sp.]
MKDYGYCDEGYARLASAIVLQALKDYRRLPGTAETNPDKAEIVAWILHGNFGDITDLDPVAVVEQLQKEDKKKCRTW